MKRTQLLVLLVVALLAVTVIPAAAVGAQDTKVKETDQPLHKAKTHPQGHTKPLTYQKAGKSAGAAPPTYTVLYASLGRAMLKRTDTYTIVCELQYADGGSGDPIEVWWKYPESQEWNYWQTVKTTYDATYGSAVATIYDRDPTHRTVEYCFVYPGDATYAGSEAYLTHHPGYTTTSLYSTNYKPGSGSSHTYDLYGQVKDYYGVTLLTGTPVDLWWRYYTNGAWGPWIFWKTVYTGSDGYWRETGVWDTLYTQYCAEYHGYPIDSASPYWYSDSRFVDVDSR